MSYFPRLAHAAKGGPDHLLKFFIDNYQDYLTQTHLSLKKKGSVRLQEAGNLDRIHLSAIMNDLTFIDIEKPNEISLIIPGDVRKLIGDKPVNIFLSGQSQTDIFDKLQEGNANIAFLSQGGEFYKNILRELNPLIESGRVTPQPRRVLMYVTETNADGSRNWSMLDADPSQMLDVWDVSKRQDTSLTIPIVQGGTIPSLEQRLLEISVPFLSGVDSDNLAKILDDEQDLLEEFRANMRLMAKNSLSDQSNIDDFIDDVMKPQISKIDRRFRKINNMNFLRVGSAVVGTAAITLASAQFGGLSAAVTTMVGGSGLALIAKETFGAQEAASTLRDENMYLLWRINGLLK